MLSICMREKIYKVPNKIIWDIFLFDRNMKEICFLSKKEKYMLWIFEIRWVFITSKTTHNHLKVRIS